MRPWTFVSVYPEPLCRFRLQRVASLAAEARTLLGEDRLSDGGDCPLRTAKNPRDLALLVKRYRLVEVSVSSVYGNVTILR